MTRHRIGLRPRRIDAYMGWMVLEEFLLLLEVSLFPLWSWWGTNYTPLALMFLTDLAIIFATTLWAAMVNNRPDIIGAFPLYYVLRFVNLYAFMKAWFEIVVQRKFRNVAPGWSTDGRRYRIMTEVVSSK
jgi:hypothetical protein